MKTNQTFEGTKGYEVLQKFQDIRTIDKIKDSSYTIENLIPGEYYEIKVLARNAVGYSLPAVKVIRTQEGKCMNCSCESFYNKNEKMLGMFK